MRIGIDVQCLPQDARSFTGISNYAFLLSKYIIKAQSTHEFVFFVNRGTKSWILREFQGSSSFGVVELPKKTVPFFTAHISFASVMQKQKLDVLHGPANVLPLAFRGRGVITIHDLAIYRHPEWFPRGQIFSTKFLVPRSIKKADAIIVPSEATRKDLVELFEVPEEKIAVIQHGVEERFFKDSVIASDSACLDERERGWEAIPKIAMVASQPRDDDKKKYILFVGTLEPRKNVPRLIQAYASLPRDLIEQYELWIVGQKAWGYEEVQSSKFKVQNENPILTDKIKILDYYPGDKLPELLQNASVFVYPSLYEGFGLPVLEAMAAGVPVVTSNLSSIPEICSTLIYRPINGRAIQACVLVNPHSVEEIRDAIAKAIRDDAYSSEISGAGIKRAREFTWERTTRKTLEVYEKAAS